jgi:hypothetical protein
VGGVTGVMIGCGTLSPGSGAPLPSRSVLARVWGAMMVVRDKDVGKDVMTRGAIYMRLTCLEDPSKKQP